MRQSFRLNSIDFIYTRSLVSINRLLGIWILISNPKLLLSRLCRYILLLGSHNTFKEEFQVNSSSSPTELTYASSPTSFVYQLTNCLQLDHSHTFLDLGSGLGNICIDIHVLTGAKTIGIECIEERFLFSQTIASKLNLNSHCTFLNHNILNKPLPKASHIYVTCTCFSTETLSKLSKQLSVVEPGTFIMTVTRSLSLKNVELFKTFNATFDWGHDMIFIYRKK